MFLTPECPSNITITRYKFRLERVQRAALKIIFACKWASYTKFLASKNIVKLEKRRVKLALNFTKKAACHEKFKHWFQVFRNIIIFSKTYYRPSIGRTESLKKSPIPHLTKLINKNNGFFN